MTRTGKSQRLSQHIAEPYAEIHPEDAVAAGIRTADIVQLDSPFGRLYARAQVTNKTPKGNVFVPIHWSGRWSAKAKPSALAGSTVDPISGQPALKRSPVRVTKFGAGWYGFAVSADEPTPKSAYWAKARILGGWRMELAGRSPAEDWIPYTQEMFGLEGVEPTSVVDTKSGRVRLAFVKDGQIKAAFFADRNPVAIARNFLVSEFAQSSGALGLLAGVPPGDQPDPGAIICTCFNVGVNTIVAAITNRDAMSVETLGSLLNAGTNCGSCRPELTALIKANLVPAISDAV
jgi:assimilatory nitrate reductase catalytic subunit